MAPTGKGRDGYSKPGSSRLNMLRESQAKEVFSWGDVDMEQLRMLFFAATINGAAVMIGAADEGESVRISLYVDNDREKRYARSAERLASHVAAYIAALGVDPEIVRQALLIADHVAAMPAD